MQTVATEPTAAPIGLTQRGIAALRLSEFQDQWDQLTQEDRAWFSDWLASLVAECQDGPTNAR